MLYLIYPIRWYRELSTSVTRSGDLLDFGQLLNAFGNTLFAQISQILKEFL